MNWQLSKGFELFLHFENNFLFFRAVHIVQIHVLVSQSFLLVVEKSIGAHVHKRFLKIGFVQLVILSEIIMIFFRLIWRVQLFLELLFA
jgi:hypothetical protein